MYVPIPILDKFKSVSSLKYQLCALFRLRSHIYGPFSSLAVALCVSDLSFNCGMVDESG